ncbi:MAG: SDR family NAD(P)-dependent oxidoreductase [Bacteroidota bacterium]
MYLKICIIGCGWLGLPLAEHLVQAGNSVNGSTTSVNKLNVLKSQGISPFLIKFSPNHIDGNIKACLNGCKTLILNIPPRLRKNPEQDYVAMMQLLIRHIESSTIENLVFISTTSVYEDTTEIPTISETSKTSDSVTASKLLKVEELFTGNPNFNTTILRFGGLIGKDRHPAKFLSGKSGIKNPNAPVNLIHQKDCISIIENIINKSIWNEVFNAAYPAHPTREEYYTKACKELNLPLPKFDQSNTSKGKIISSEKLARILNYRFEQPINN